MKLLLALAMCFVAATSTRITLDQTKPSRGFHTQDQMTAHNAKALVMTCIDFRLVDDAAVIQWRKGLHNNYDTFALAGSSLGYLREEKWRSAFNDTVKLALKLHHIKTVKMVDHMDCGYYKAVYPELVDNPDLEKEKHFETFQLAEEQFKQDFPDLLFQGELVGLDGREIKP